MIYSVWWRRADGALCERSLALDPLTQFLATLATVDMPASVVDECGRVVGAVYAPREVMSGAPSEAGRSQWYLELGVELEIGDSRTQALAPGLAGGWPIPTPPLQRCTRLAPSHPPDALDRNLKR